jgi:hypothetical protein
MASGFMDSFGAALSGLQAEEQQRNQITQQLLIQLVSQNPALAETPEIQQALQEAYPGEQYAGVADSLGALNQVRLNEEARLKEQADLARENEQIEALSGQLAMMGDTDVPAGAGSDELLRRIAAFTQAGKEVDAGAATAQDLLDHQQRLEEIELQNQGRGGIDSATAAILAMGQTSQGLLEALVDAQKVTDTPQLGAGAEEAAQALQDEVGLRVAQNDQRLSAVVRLHQGMDVEKRPSVAYLWNALNADPNAFEEVWGDRWINARNSTTFNSGREGEVTQGLIANNPEAAEVRRGYVDEAMQYYEEQSQNLRRPEPNQAAFNVVDQVRAAGGQPSVFGGLPVDMDGNMIPDEQPPVITEPSIQFEDMPPEAQTMMLEAEETPPLMQGYMTILSLAPPGDDRWAVEQMRLLRQEFARRGVIIPAYGE